jgi:hypothetical protein
MYGAAPDPGLWPWTESPSQTAPAPSPRAFDLLARMLPTPAGVAAIEEARDRLVQMRLAPTTTDPAMRAELDSLVGLLTIALATTKPEVTP